MIDKFGNLEDLIAKIMADPTQCLELLEQCSELQVKLLDTK
jgi:hypothetical protein